jgi:release factor glutamine methyltransferase
VSDRVFVREGDLLDPVPGIVDVVVANLPYLPASERDPHPDLCGEPAAAVFAPGDGLACYRRLLQTAASRLSEHGLLALQLRGRIYSAERRRLHELEIQVQATAA